MENFFSFSSQHDSAKNVINDCVHQLGTAPTDANFGFIYTTDSMTANFPELIKQCKAASGIKHWVGTIGLGIITTNKEIYDKPAASIMLANFDENEFAMMPSVNNQGELTSGIHWPHEFATNFGVIHGDPFNDETQNLIEDLQQQLENGFIVGGLTSSRSKQYQVSNDVVSGGISGVVFSEEIGVVTNLSQGCSPVGVKHTITKASENTALTIDKKPALEVMMHDMGVSNYKELSDNANEIFAGLCIPGSDKSDYTIRNIVGFDISHNIFAINDFLADDDEIIFCNRNEQAAIDDMQHMLDNMAKRLNKDSSGYQIKGGIYVSCMGRGREQFGNDSEEIKLIHKTLGDFPLTGFFANGEIHHNKLYGYTGVLTLFI